jgi:hypothetical protein
MLWDGQVEASFKSAENGIYSRLIPRSLGFEQLHDIRVDPQR